MDRLDRNHKDALEDLLKQIEREKARMRLKDAFDEVIMSLHRLSHDDAVALYNALVVRLAGPK